MNEIYFSLFIGSSVILWGKVDARDFNKNCVSNRVDELCKTDGIVNRVNVYNGQEYEYFYIR